MDWTMESHEKLENKTFLGHFWNARILRHFCMSESPNFLLCSIFRQFWKKLSHNTLPP